jgi:membrane associated rhomboid family serine protease/Zn-finger nucleic acid-binding protein
MFTCPNCAAGLARVKRDQGFFYVCGKCGGQAANLAVLRRVVKPECLRGLWMQATAGGGPSGKDCPVCHRPMQQTAVPRPVGALPVGVCPRCQFLWLEPHEIEQLPRPPAALPPPELSEKAREAVAMAQLQLDAARHPEPADTGDAPEETWQWIPGMLGMPVEIDAPPQVHWPWLTYGLALVLALVFAATYDAVNDAFKQFGLVPAAPWRNGGTTFLTSFFIHVGLWHLVGNVYFLVVFGRHVEDYLGPARLAFLLLAATLLGGLMHVVADPHADIPCGGASGGISGVIMFYAMQFPQARIGLMFRYSFYFRWLSVSAITALALWLLLQFVGAYLQLHGISSVSSLAHLGGALAGLGAWFVWEKRARKDAAAAPESEESRVAVRADVKS